MAGRSGLRRRAHPRGRRRVRQRKARLAILIGPEFGTVPRPDLVAAAREAGDADFDVLIAAPSITTPIPELHELGRIPVPRGA